MEEIAAMDKQRQEATDSYDNLCKHILNANTDPSGCKRQPDPRWKNVKI
jgi:hypothetical protein